MTMNRPARRTRRRYHHETTAPSEAMLTRRLAAGDETVMRDLYRLYSGRVLVMTTRLLGDRELAQDAVQETFVRVWRFADSLDPDRDLEPWLFRVARNTAYDLNRKRQRRPQAADADPTPVLEAVSEHRPDQRPDEAAMAAATMWQVRGAIDELPGGEREVVRLQHLEGYTQPEIADLLGISVGTVKSRSHRAHRRLAAALRARGATLDLED